MKNSKNFMPKEHGSPYLQFLERRSIPLYKEDERHLASFPIERNENEFPFLKTIKDRLWLSSVKSAWKLTLPPDYKPTLLIRA